MMKRIACIIALAVLTACSSDTTAPAAEELLSGINTDLVQQYDATNASAMDRSGIGGSAFPDSIALTTEQKAKIQALHEAYRSANAADLAALAAIEAELKAAIRAGKPRAELAAILARAEPIHGRLRAALARLHSDIMAVYTPAQLAWLNNRGRDDKACRPDVLNSLSEAQVQKIRTLKAEFTEAVKGYVAAIQKVNEEARAAAQSGASREEIRKILEKAKAPLEALAKAERELANAILNVLTAEQKANACLVRALIGR